MATLVEVNRLKRHAHQIHIIRPRVPYDTLTHRMEHGDKLYGVLVYQPDAAKGDEFAAIRTIGNERDYDRTMSEANKATRFRHLEWYVQHPVQRRAMLTEELRSLEASMGSGTPQFVLRQQELRQEISKLDRQLAGKHAYPMWHPRRWIKPRS